MKSQNLKHLSVSEICNCHYVMYDVSELISS